VSNVTALKPTAREMLAGIKIIDVDTHVSEWPELWTERAPAAYKNRMPRIVGKGAERKWIIDEDTFIYNSGAAAAVMKDGSKARGAVFAGTEIHEVHAGAYDVHARVKMMDEQGIHAQIAYPNVLGFSGQNAMKTDPKLRLMAMQIFNDAMGDYQKDSGQRIMPMPMLPWWDVEESVKEIKWGKDNGAVGVFFRGIEGQRTLDNPYFNPIYQAASDTDLPILIHTGAGCPLFLNLFDVERNHTFGHSRVQPLFAFRDLIHNKIPEQFPKLKFGFIEASAGWVPFMMHIIKRLFREKWKFSSDKDMFSAYRIFVACEADEDVKYISEYTGEDHLIIGSDYGHQDPSEERQLVAAMRAREDIPPALTDKIFFENPKLLYPLN